MKTYLKPVISNLQTVLFLLDKRRRSGSFSAYVIPSHNNARFAWKCNLFEYSYFIPNSILTYYLLFYLIICKKASGPLRLHLLKRDIDKINWCYWFLLKYTLFASTLGSWRYCGVHCFYMKMSLHLGGPVCRNLYLNVTTCSACFILFSHFFIDCKGMQEFYSVLKLVITVYSVTCGSLFQLVTAQGFRFYDLTYSTTN